MVSSAPSPAGGDSAPTGRGDPGGRSLALPCWDHDCDVRGLSGRVSTRIPWYSSSDHQFPLTVTDMQTTIMKVAQKNCDILSKFSMRN